MWMRQHILNLFLIIVELFRLEKGASGCPILNDKRKVIGILFGGRNGKKFILHAGYIKKKLHKYLLEKQK